MKRLVYKKVEKFLGERDMKRVTISVAIALVLLAAVVCNGQWPLGREALPGIKQEPGPTITVSGRFQIFTSPNVKGETFMLDTDSGRIWILKKDGTTGLFSMERVAVQEVDGARKDDSKDKAPGEK
jgi:hypothetical protein